MATELAALPTVRERSLSLYQLETQLVELMAFLEEAESEEERLAARNEIARYVGQEIQKVDGIRAYIMHCRMMKSEALAEADRQRTRAASWEKAEAALKEATLGAMDAAGKKRLEGKTGTLMVKGNGGVAPLRITDEGLIPEELCSYKASIPGKTFATMIKFFPGLKDIAERQVSNTGVREALKAGPVAGAYLEDRGVHLEVK